MVFNFTLTDVEVWFAMASMVLLITSEVVSPYYRRVNMLLELRKLRPVAIAFGVMFLVIISLIIGMTIAKA